MAYTPEQLSSMTDHEINMAVAKKLNLEFKAIKTKSIDWCEVKNPVNRTWDLFEPCMDWGAVMPIAIEYGIGLSQMANGSTRVFCYTPFISKRGERTGFLNNDHPNPRRAICEVFLMMEI